MAADDVNLEDDAPVVDELLQDERRAELPEPLSVVDEGHLVRLGAAVGDEGLGNEREAERGEEARVGERGGVVDDDLAGDAEGVAAVSGGGVAERDVELGDDLEHGDAVVEAVDGVGRVDDGDGGVAGGEGLELGAPVVAVELVDDEVEGALVREGPRVVDGDEVHAARRRAGDERGLDEAVLLLGRERVADDVAAAVGGGGLGGGGHCGLGGLEESGIWMGWIKGGEGCDALSFINRSINELR